MVLKELYRVDEEAQKNFLKEVSHEQIKLLKFIFSFNYNKISLVRTGTNACQLIVAGRCATFLAPQ